MGIDSNCLLSIIICPFCDQIIKGLLNFHVIAQYFRNSISMTDQLSEQHETYFRAVFQEFDTAGKNILTKEQLRLLMAALGEDIDEDTINQLMIEIDYDCSGTINCQEFLHLMYILLKRADPKAQFAEAFKLFDRDGNGSISASELKQVMANLGKDLSDAEVQQIFRRVGLEGRGQMDQSRFIKLLMKNQE